MNVSTMGVESPPPEGVMAMAPVYTEFGVTEKAVDAAPTTPLCGPVNV